MSKTMKYMFFEVLAFIFTAIVACSIYCLQPSTVAYAEEVSMEEVPAEAQEEPEKTSWTVYLEEKIVPGAILVVTAIGSIYIAIAPILSKVKKSSGLFESATKNVNAATNKTIENEKKVANLEERLDKIEKATLNTEEITRIGFCNLDELVAKGYANEISKIGDENENGEIKK